MSIVDLSIPETFKPTEEDYNDYRKANANLTNCVVRKNPEVPFCEALGGCPIPDLDVGGKTVHAIIRGLVRC